MARDACPFGLCDGSGFIIGDDLTAADCQCRPRKVARARAKALAGRIPKKYRNLGFEREPIASMPDGVRRQVRGYIRHLDERLEEGRGLWIFGEVGTGKTSLAMMVSEAALEQGHTVAVYSLPRLLSEIRDTYEASTDYRYIQFLDELQRVDLLQIDDVGAEAPSAWVLEQLYAVVNGRYEEGRSIIITTNLVDEELADQIGKRTVSRLEEMCEILPLYGEDRRRQRFEAPSDIKASQADPYDPAGISRL